MFEEITAPPKLPNTHFHFVKPYPLPDRTVSPPPTPLGKTSLARPLPKPIAEAPEVPQPAPGEGQTQQTNDLISPTSALPDNPLARKETNEALIHATRAGPELQAIVPKRDPDELELAARGFLFEEERKPVIKQEASTVKQEPEVTFERLQSAVRTFQERFPGVPIKAEDPAVKQEQREQQELAREIAQFQAENPHYNADIDPKREPTAELDDYEQESIEIKAELQAYYAEFKARNPGYELQDVKEEEDGTVAKRVKLEYEDSHRLL